MDGDVLVYRAGFAAEHTLYDVTVNEPNGVTTVRTFESKKEMMEYLEWAGLTTDKVTIVVRKEIEPEGNALFNARSMIRTVKDKMETDDIIVYLSGPTNFRLGLATIKPYKGNRDETHKPVHAAAIKAMIRREFDTVTSLDQEADDDIAIAHYAMWCKDPYSTVIATIDKDLDMVPGLHFNFADDRQYYVEPEDGIRAFYEQLLKGDTTDNIPGLPGIGKVKAKKLLADCTTERQMYEVAQALYVEGYPDNPDAALLENARLLWMRLEPNQWWNPPTGE